MNCYVRRARQKNDVILATDLYYATRAVGPCKGLLQAGWNAIGEPRYIGTEPAIRMSLTSCGHEGRRRMRKMRGNKMTIGPRMNPINAMPNSIAAGLKAAMDFATATALLAFGRKRGRT